MISPYELEAWVDKFIAALVLGTAMLLVALVIHWNVTYEPQRWDVYTENTVYRGMEWGNDDWFFRDGRRFKFNENYEVRPAE